MYHIDQINDEIRRSPAHLIAAWDDDYDARIGAVADAILADPQQNRIIMLSGPSASGKTTTTLKLEHSLEARGVTAHTISLDDFFLDRDKMVREPDGTVDYESVKTLDLTLLGDCLRSIAAGEETAMPQFHFKSGKSLRDAYRLRCGPNDIALVEGIHALDSAVLASLPETVFKLYLSVSSDIDLGNGETFPKRQLRLLRRLVRDYNFRGSSAVNTFTLWKGVVASEVKNILPFKKNAQMTIDSVCPYDPPVLREAAIPLLRGAAAVSENRELAEMMLDKLARFALLPTEYVPPTSLVREFIGGSVYYGN